MLVKVLEIAIKDSDTTENILNLTENLLDMNLQQLTYCEKQNLVVMDICDKSSEFEIIDNLHDLGFTAVYRGVHNLY